jgi:iron complex outermembrane receptor protein
MPKPPRAAALLLGLAPALVAAAPQELSSLSLEQLSAIVVTSVSRQEERLSNAAASIFIISSSDIMRSGARSLPEVLRLAPNLQVARDDARNYAITARGFNNPFANKLLVPIDGRSIYSPLFSGVFWDAQDSVMSDFDISAIGQNLLHARHAEYGAAPNRSVFQRTVLLKIGKRF